MDLQMFWDTKNMNWLSVITYFFYGLFIFLVASKFVASYYQDGGQGIVVRVRK
jgi:hypothetical protein